MNKRNIILIAIIMILCTSYIFGFEYYDRVPTRVQRLSQLISIPDLEVTEVGVKLNGIYYGERLNLKEVLIRENKLLGEMAHEINCSKLCKLFHYNSASTSIEQQDNDITVVGTNCDDDTPYTLTIKNQKDKDYNTYYDFNFTGLTNLKRLDMRRDRTLNLLKKWGVHPKESIYFKGELLGDLLENQRLEITQMIFSHLKGNITNIYQDDMNTKTMAYYGYTKEFSQYIEDSSGAKSNVQVSFTYNESTNKTECIIAFPFYNEPF